MSTSQASNIVYEFNEEFIVGASHRTVCIAPQGTTLGALTKDELVAKFGGYISYVDDSTGTVYLGVWGTRNAGRFRTMLKDRGVDFGIIRTRPPTLRFKASAVAPE